MEIKLTYLTISIGLLLLISCVTSQPTASSTKTESRIIILDGDTLSEKYLGGFTSWQCKDFTYGGRTLVEVGFFGDPSLKNIGFILFDGGNEGESTTYGRAGLNQRWDWGLNATDYSFIVKPDGTGLYYDFTTVPDGESSKARDVYKCYQK